MANYELSADEVILYEGDSSITTIDGNKNSHTLQITLTSQKLILEREKGVFKKEHELIDIIQLDNVKIYNDMAQVKQKSNTVEIQADKNIKLTFNGMIEARKFTGKIIDAVTGTTLAKRSSEKIKSAFNMVDDTLGLDTRETVKGVIENGVTGTLIHGIGHITKRKHKK